MDHFGFKNQDCDNSLVSPVKKHRSAFSPHKSPLKPRCRRDLSARHGSISRVLFLDVEPSSECAKKDHEVPLSISVPEDVMGGKDVSFVQTDGSAHFPQPQERLPQQYVMTDLMHGVPSFQKGPSPSPTSAPASSEVTAYRAAPLPDDFSRSPFAGDAFAFEAEGGGGRQQQQQQQHQQQQPQKGKKRVFSEQPYNPYAWAMSSAIVDYLSFMRVEIVDSERLMNIYKEIRKYCLNWLSTQHRYEEAEDLTQNTRINQSKRPFGSNRCLGMKSCSGKGAEKRKGLDIGSHKTRFEDIVCGKYMEIYTVCYGWCSDSMIKHDAYELRYIRTAVSEAINSSM